MTDRQLLLLARQHLTDPEFQVWFAKHYNGNGRRSGSLALNITPETFRHRLRSAEQKLATHLQETTCDT